MSASQTPGRRSTRERRSPRNPSPMTTRGPRSSGLSYVETIQPDDTLDNGAHLPSTTSDLTRSANIENHGKNGTHMPTSTSQKIPRIFMRVKAPDSTPMPAASLDRDDSKARKSGRMSEVTRPEQQPSSGGGYDDVDLSRGAIRVEESGDDDYNPGYKAVKVKRSKKSLDPVVNTTGSFNPPAPLPRATLHKATVESAIGVARKRKNDVLAVTLKLLYEQALLDDSLAILLEVTLSSKADENQQELFQDHVKIQRKNARDILDAQPGVIDYELPPIPAAENPSFVPTTGSEKAASQTPAPPTKRKYTKRQPVDVASPSNAEVTTRARGGRKQFASPVPASSKQSTRQYLEPPQPAEPAMTTRGGKKRASTTPEPSALSTHDVLGNGDEGRPRKRARRSPPEAESNDVPMIEDSLSELSESDLSELPDLGNSSPEPPPEMLGDSSFGGTDRLSTTVHGFRKGGRQLKRQPEPGQKVKTTAATKHGIGLPDDRMQAEKERFAREQNRDGPEPTYSELRDRYQPSRAPRPTSDIDGVFTPLARDNIERHRAQSPATSSIQGDLLIAPPPGYAKPTSRASTPAAFGRGSARAPRKSRMVISPVKKKTVAGGIGSSFGAGGNSPVGDRADGESNTDFCITCGGPGELICCDGCPRAFHLICCDPPFTPDNPVPGDDTAWLCAVCEGKRQALERPEKQRMLFATLLQDIHRHNPNKFALPRSVQTRFEGVQVTDDGTYQYDEGVQAKHRTRASGPTAEAETDPFKVKDSKGNFVLCFYCGLSAAGKREIIKCDYCGLHWHLDCLTPPPANAPVRQPLDGRPRPLWKCPGHATNAKATYGEARSSHKIRRPRDVKVVDTLLSRGLKNTGNIEIENDPSDVEDDADMFNDDGSIYRVTEKSVKLDFIDRVNREREMREAEDLRRSEEAFRALDVQRQANFDFNMRSFVDQRAALSLLELNQEPAKQDGPTTDTALSNDKLQSLIHELVAEAPSEVVALLADAPPKRPSVNGSLLANADSNSVKRTSQTHKERNSLGTYDRRSLLMLRDMLTKKLDEMVDEGEEGEEEVNCVNKTGVVNGIS